MKKQGKIIRNLIEDFIQIRIRFSLIDVFQIEYVRPDKNANKETIKTVNCLTYKSSKL